MLPEIVGVNSFCIVSKVSICFSPKYRILKIIFYHPVIDLTVFLWSNFVTQIINPHS